MPRRRAEYLYAVTDRKDRAPVALNGLDDAPVRTVQVQSLRAVVSRLEATDLAPTPMRLWQHERVVESFMRRGPVLPAPFALTLPPEIDVATLLEERGEAYTEALNRLRDCVELSVRVMRVKPLASVQSMPGDNPLPCLLPSEHNDPAFLFARQVARQQSACRRRRDDSLIEMVHRVLAPMAVDHQVKRTEGGAMLCLAAYLVEKDQVEPFTSTLWAFSSRYSSVHTLCTGPWPPYHFVDLL